MLANSIKIDDWGNGKVRNVYFLYERYWKKDYVASWLQLKYPMILNSYMKTAIDNNCLRNVQKV